MMKCLKYLTAYIVRDLKWFQNWITEKNPNKCGLKDKGIDENIIKVNDNYIRREKAEEETRFNSWVHQDD